MTDAQLIERIRTGLHDEVARVNPPATLLEQLRSAPAARARSAFRIPAGLAPAFGLLASVAVAVAVVMAFVSLHHDTAAPGVPPGTPAGARALVARLAVLRRPQTAADRLPARLSAQLPGIGLGFRIIPQLTRLAATIDAGAGLLSSVDIYVVVGGPPGVPVDIVTTLAVAGGSTLLGQPEVVDDPIAIATGGLTPTAVGSAGDYRVVANRGTVATGQSGVNLSVVPDGVTRVKWVFGARALYPQIENNVAVTRVAGPQGLSDATWYGAHGQVIASVSPQAQRQALQARALAASERDPIAPELAAHFAIFRRPVPPPASNTFPPARIARGAIGNYGYDQDNGYRVNVAQARFVPYPGTAGFWVIPGTRGVSMAALGSGGDSVPIAVALSGRLITTTCCGANGETVWGLAPDGNPTITIVLASGARRAVPVLDNVYSVTGRIRAINLRDAAGRRIALRPPG